jgi:hypothetical protein
LIKTGLPQEFETHELGPITSKWPLMSDVTNIGNNYKLILKPSSALLNRKRGVRVDFIGHNDAEQVRYELLDLKPVRIGTDEVEIAISGKNTPFTLLLMMSNPPKVDAALNIENDWTGREPKEVMKASDAFSLLRPSGQIRVFDLETEKYFIEANVQLPEETPSHVKRRNLIADIARIAAQFKAPLRLPKKIEKNDLETIQFVKQFMENGTIEVDIISVVITKSIDSHDRLAQSLSNGRGFFKMEQTQEKPPRIFGMPVNMGRLVMETEAEISDLAGTLQRIAEAKIGEGVRIVLKPLSPVRVSLAGTNRAVE